MKINALNGRFEDLGFGFGIVTVNVEDIQKTAEIPEIQYIELPKTLYTSYIESNKSSCIPEVWSLYGLTGKGVLVGFIDSGIDYTHRAFRDNNGNTRIEYIYDLNTDIVYDKQKINEALKSQNPYSIVPVADEIGHGTHVAGTACGNGNIDKRYYGAAYEASIAMVKMTREGKVNYGKSTQIMRAVKFLIERSKFLKMPLVINLSFSTNDGAHDGKSILEQYIDTVCKFERLSFAVSAGNEGNAAHHAGGMLKQKQNVNVNIASDETSVVFQLYKNLLDDIDMEIKSPDGKTTGILPITEGYKNGSISGNSYFIYDTGPKPFNMNSEIIISIVKENGFIDSGTWSIIIYSNDNEENNFDIWMPVSEGLNSKTKFLNPNIYNTLGIPATVGNVISVGSYDYRTNSISAFSGRGKLISQNIKPDITAPGEMIYSSIPGGGFDVMTGTSMACPHVAGSCALLMQWGIVQGNDFYMYGDRLKYFLIKGAARDKKDVIYPDAAWGYGTLCVNRALNEAQEIRNMPIKRYLTRQSCEQFYYDENYIEFIVEYDGNIKEVFSKLDYACAFVLDDNYAVVYVDKDKAEYLFKNTDEIIYAERPALYTLSSLSPLDTSNISKFHDNKFLALRGTGVMVGIIDTGIDYLNNEFMYEDDTTRILRIWDQTLRDGNKPADFGYGIEYTQEEINNAINIEKSGGDPYSVVKSKDTIGHGTEMAGIIGARGTKGNIIGAAPDCMFCIVKLKNAKKSKISQAGVSESSVPVYDTTDIISAVSYIYSTAKKMNMPVVTYIPLESNMGSHDGNSLLERYIDEISKIRGTASVCGTGNQGDTSTHTAGLITNEERVRNIELEVDEFEQNLSIQVWTHKPDKVSLSIISPSGEIISNTPPKLQSEQEFKLIFEGSLVTIRYYFPEEISGDELIEVTIKNIKGGIWQFRVIGEQIINGEFDMWIPQRELLREKTRFLNSNPYITLALPSTAKKIICCAYYDQNNNSIVSQSGRGYTRDNRIKPDTACGGINVLTVKPGGEIVSVSGSSAASAVLAGAVALILEWGIVLKNDVTMYSTKINTYIIRGTQKREGDIYPNRQWGYGIFDLQKVFENIRGLNYTRKDNSDDVYINVPDELLKLL